MISSRSTAGRTFRSLCSRAHWNSSRPTPLTSGADDGAPGTAGAVDAGAELGAAGKGAEAGAAVKVVVSEAETAGGRSPGRMTSPLAMTVARWMTFSNSRTLPGQLKRWRSSTAAGTMNLG